MSLAFGFALPHWQAISGGFSPQSLFTGGVQGVLFDISDLTTLFTTSAGTTPVAMPGQGSAVSVGLMLDKSQGLVLGSELVTNGDFSGGTTGWTLGAGWSVSGGQLVATAVAFGVEAKQAIASLVANNRYVVTFTVTVTSGILKVNLGDLGVSSAELTVTASGTYTYRPPRIGAAQITFWASSTFTGSIDNVSVRELPGNHAIAFNDTTARPELRARVNLLTYSEQFDNAAWTKVNTTITANAATAPDGTTTADLVYPSTSGTDRYVWQQVTGLTTGATFKTSIRLKNSGINFAYIYNVRGNQLFYVNLTTGATSNVGTNISNLTSSVDANGWVTVTFESVLIDAQTTAYIFVGASDAAGSTSVTASGTNGILVWGADLRPANIGANVPAYQRIADANTYDTSGFPLYLRFDGIDDSMYTPANLDLSGTDKATVFAGVRKLSDATQVINELSAFVDTNNGAYALGSITGSSNYFSALRGTALAYYTETTYAAPISNVHTTSYDIAGAAIAQEIIPRVNGLTPTLAATGANAGAGNYGTYPLYIGSRNNSIFFFNGHLHSLLVVGSAVSAGNISATEQWVAGKTGITI